MHTPLRGNITTDLVWIFARDGWPVFTLLHLARKLMAAKASLFFFGDRKSGNSCFKVLRWLWSFPLIGQKIEWICLFFFFWCVWVWVSLIGWFVWRENFTQTSLGLDFFLVCARWKTMVSNWLLPVFSLVVYLYFEW